MAWKLADLEVVRGDLTASLLAIREVTTVFKDGVGCDSPKLIAPGEGAVGIDGKRLRIADCV